MRSASTPPNGREDHRRAELEDRHEAELDRRTAERQDEPRQADLLHPGADQAHRPGRTSRGGSSGRRGPRSRACSPPRAARSGSERGWSGRAPDGGALAKAPALREVAHANHTLRVASGGAAGRSAPLRHAGRHARPERPQRVAVDTDRRRHATTARTIPPAPAPRLIATGAPNAWAMAPANRPPSGAGAGEDRDVQRHHAAAQRVGNAVLDRDVDGVDHEHRREADAEQHREREQAGFGRSRARAQGPGTRRRPRRCSRSIGRRLLTNASISEPTSDPAPMCREQRAVAARIHPERVAGEERQERLEVHRQHGHAAEQDERPQHGRRRDARSARPPPGWSAPRGTGAGRGTWRKTLPSSIQSPTRTER